MSVRIENYSDKAIIVKGDTKPYREAIKDIGGKWNGGLEGWIFSKNKEKNVSELIEKINTGKVKKVDEFKAKEEKNYISKSEFLNLISRVERLEQLVNKLSDGLIDLEGDKVVHIEKNNGESKGEKKVKKNEKKEKSVKNVDSDSDSDEVQILKPKRLLGTVKKGEKVEKKGNN